MLVQGSLTKALVSVTLHGLERSGVALEAIALAIENEAKRNASNGSHRWGTPTPASPGSGPAVITGDLRRAITHTRPTVSGTGFECRVGPADVPHSRGAARRIKATGRVRARRGGRSSSATSGQIGRYLETGLRNGARYPFLEPAFRKVAVATVPLTFASAMEPWPRAS